MPLYEYHCNACGTTQECLQKMTDPVLEECPICHSTDFHKQVSAAGFQLKGTGWYETDFKGCPAAASSEKAPAHSCPAAGKCGCA